MYHSYDQFIVDGLTSLLSASVWVWIKEIQSYPVMKLLLLIIIAS